MYVLFNEGCGGGGAGWTTEPRRDPMYVLFNEGWGGGGAGWTTEPRRDPMYVLSNEGCGGGGEQGGQLSHAAILCMYCLMRVGGGGSRVDN